MTKHEVIAKLEKLGVEVDESRSSTDLKRLLKKVQSEEVKTEQVKEDVVQDLVIKESVPVEKAKGKKYSGIKMIFGKYVTEDGKEFDSVDLAAEHNFK